MDTRLSTAALSPYHWKQLVLWAACDNKRKSALSRDILVARIEANRELIDLKVSAYADEYGVSVERLTEAMLKLDTENVSPTKFHDRLKAELDEENET